MINYFQNQKNLLSDRKKFIISITKQREMPKTLNRVGKNIKFLMLFDLQKHFQLCQDHGMHSTVRRLQRIHNFSQEITAR